MVSNHIMIMIMNDRTHWYIPVGFEWTCSISYRSTAMQNTELCILATVYRISLIESPAFSQSSLLNPLNHPHWSLFSNHQSTPVSRSQTTLSDINELSNCRYCRINALINALIRQLYFQHVQCAWNNFCVLFHM